MEWSHDMNTKQLPFSCTGLVRLMLVMSLFTGCASFRSDLESAYQGEVKRNPDTKPVSVVFVFSHVRQTLGLDAIPKLVAKQQNVSGFDEILGDALPEISNLGSYATYTEEAADVNRPERRAVRDSLMRVSDYTIKIRIESTKRFTKHFLGALASTVTATILPVPYVKAYSLKAQVFDRKRLLLATYTRQAHLTKWVEALLVFAYPFYPEERKREEIYMDFLHDTFRQIESEGVLVAK